jgi:hypothetical protein
MKLKKRRSAYPLQNKFDKLSSSFPMKELLLSMEKVLLSQGIHTVITKAGQRHLEN